MIFKLRNFHRFFFTYICPTFYGGAPSTPTNTTSNVTQNTIPKELMPYASGMLQAAKQQLYTTDAQGKITGYQPYKPFSTNANDYVAGFTPLQQQAQQGAANLQLPGQFGQATNLAQQAGNYSQLAQDPNAVAGFMSPYMQNVVDRQKMEANRDFDIKGTQQMGQATGAGAFGGSRDAIMAAENERNRQWKLSNIQESGTQNAFQNAQQNMQFGNQAQLASAQALGQLGEAQQGANLNMLNAQNAFGGQQQQQQQQGINQAVLNYQNEINQPYVAAGTMSDLVRGTPMNNMTTMNYQAQPGFMQQAGGALGTAASLYGAYKSGKGNKNGGIIDAYAEGGVTDVSAVSSYLDNLTIPQLHQLRDKSQSVENTKAIDEILARKEGGVAKFAEGDLVEYEPDYPTSSEPTEEYLRHKIKNESVRNARGIARIPGEEAVRSSKEGIKSGRVLDSTISQGKELSTKVIPESSMGSTIPQGKEISTNVKPTIDPMEGTKNISMSGIKSAVGKAAAKGLGIASIPAMAVDAAETASEVSPMDRVLMVQAEKGDERAKAILARGGSNPILESIKKPVREGINKYTQQAWDYIKSIPAVSAESPKAETKEVAKGIAPLPTDKQSYNVPGGPLDTAQQSIVTPKAQPTASPTQPTSEGINTGADQNLNTSITDAMTNAGMTTPVVSNADERGVSKEDYDKSVAEEKRLTGMSTEDIMRERNAEMERLGIKPPDQLNAEERKRIGEERVNAQDEQKRQVYLRMAEFFSNWGSTPGAPLAAGLKAMKETLPGVMDDSKAHQKLMHDLNKSESDLNRAVELEKAGRFDKASALKDAASKRLQDHEGSWMVLSMKKQMGDAENANRVQTTGMTTGAMLAGKAIEASARAKQEKAVMNHEITQYQNSLNAETRNLTNLQKTFPKDEAAIIESEARIQSYNDELANLRTKPATNPINTWSAEKKAAYEQWKKAKSTEG